MYLLLNSYKGVIYPSNISLSQNTLDIYAGNTYQLTARVNPANTKFKNITRSSTDSTIVKVDSNGLVTGVGDGVTTIKVTGYGVEAICNCTSTIAHPTSVSLNETEIEIEEGKTFQLTATVTPSYALNKNVTWKSSDNKVATVSSTGLVSYKDAGECIITCTTVDGGKTATCVVSCGKVPSAYQEVEYIQSSGTQHINTGYYHTANTEVEIKFNHQSSGGTYDFYGIYGGRTKHNSADCLAIWSKSGSYLGYGIGGKYSDTFKSISRNTDYTVKFNKSSITVNGITTSLSTSLTSCSYTDWVFGMNQQGSLTDYKISAKLYYCKVSENGTLKRDLVPCYRKSDNVIGMYDLVEGKFYTNSGSGTFTKGDDV